MTLRIFAVISISWKWERDLLFDDEEITKKKVVFTLSVSESGTFGN
jgi:hypothetical protein